MDKTEPKLTKKQLLVIPVVLEARSISDGVKKAGISKTTFYAWLKDPLFKAEFVRQRQEIIDLALHELKTLQVRRYLFLESFYGLEMKVLGSGQHRQLSRMSLSP